MNDSKENKTKFPRLLPSFWPQKPGDFLKSKNFCQDEKRVSSGEALSAYSSFPARIKSKPAPQGWITTPDTVLPVK